MYTSPFIPLSSNYFHESKHEHSTCYNFSGGYRLYQAIVENAFNEQANTPCGFCIGDGK